MDWIPSETDLLTVIGALLAAGLAGVSIVAGLHQFSGSARARRTIEWTSAALKEEESENRREVLNLLKVRNQGILASLQLVRGWRFIEPALPIFLIPLLTFRQLDGEGVWIGFALDSLSLLAILAFSLRRIIRLYCERIRVVENFCASQPNILPVEDQFIQQIKGGTRKETLLAGISAALLIATVFFAGKLFTSDPSVPCSVVLSFLLVISLVLILTALFRIKKYAYEQATNSSPSVLS